MKPLTWKKGRSLLPVVRKFGVLDWLLVVCVTICAHVLRFSNLPADFSTSASSDLSSPVRTETLSYAMVAVFVYVLGSLACAFVWMTQRRDISLLRVLCAYFFAVSVTAFIGSVIQLVVGRPLPDTIAVCGGDGSFAQCAQVLSAGELRAQLAVRPAEREGPLRVLSIGSGVGYMEKILLEELPELELHVNEPSTVSLRWLRKVIPGERIYIGLPPACLPSDVQYDMIYLSTVDYGIPQRELEHLLAELRAQLAPGGGINGISELLRAGSGGGDLKFRLAAGFLYQVLHYKFRHRAAADVAVTHKQDFCHLFLPSKAIKD